MYLITKSIELLFSYIYPFKRQSHKMVKHTQFVDFFRVNIVRLSGNNQTVFQLIVSTPTSWNVFEMIRKSVNL